MWEGDYSEKNSSKEMPISADHCVSQECKQFLQTDKPTKIRECLGRSLMIFSHKEKYVITAPEDLKTNFSEYKVLALKMYKASRENKQRN